MNREGVEGPEPILQLRRGRSRAQNPLQRRSAIVKENRDVCNCYHSTDDAHSTSTILLTPREAEEIPAQPQLQQLVHCNERLSSNLWAAT